MLVMLVQNKILTAEAQRTRRINLFLQSNQRFLGLWPYRRNKVSDPIAVSRLDRNKIPLCALCGSAVNLILGQVEINSKVQ